MLLEEKWRIQVLERHWWRWQEISNWEFYSKWFFRFSHQRELCSWFFGKISLVESVTVSVYQFAHGRMVCGAGRLCRGPAALFAAAAAAPGWISGRRLQARAELKELPVAGCQSMVLMICWCVASHLHKYLQNLQAKKIKKRYIKHAKQLHRHITTELSQSGFVLHLLHLRCCTSWLPSWGEHASSMRRRVPLQCRWNHNSDEHCLGT